MSINTLVGVTISSTGSSASPIKGPKGKMASREGAEARGLVILLVAGVLWGAS